MLVICYFNMPVFQLSDDFLFPDPANSEPDGLLAVGGDLSAERLILAYSNGIFPWYSEGSPILWWSPDPRLILYPNDLKVSNSLKQTLKRKLFRVEFDTNFAKVIQQCAVVNRKDQDDTWITEEMQKAYIRLHDLGYAHSAEAYLDDELVGGLYGLSLGKAFFGESMFQLKTDASKVVLFHLVEKLKLWNFDFIDAQVKTSHLMRMGAREIGREEYLLLLQSAMDGKTIKGKWRE